MAYSKGEIAGFEAKDLRITKIAVCKSLIEKLSVEEINDTEKVFELADKYVDYIYGNVDKGIESGTVSDLSKKSDSSVERCDFATIASMNKLPIPTEKEIVILTELYHEYKNLIPKEQASEINSAGLCSEVIKAFGKYPSIKNSIEKVLSVVKLETILN